LKEETGFIAKKWTYLGVVNPSTSVIDSPNYMYLAQGLTQTKSKQEGTETIKVIKLPLQKAVDLVMKNKIMHGASSIALLKIRSLKLK
jgi:8-oxo-dGTP pyrophosphatase MutT (NUDIX family)